jgi:hypothetical protein
MTRGWLLACVLAGCGSTPPTISASAPSDRPTRVTIDYSFHGYEGARRERYELALAGADYVVRGRHIPARLVDALLTAQTDLRPTDEVLECNSHTDDDRSYKLVVEGPRPFELQARSNCTLEIPWTVTRDGAMRVQFSGALGRAVEQLLAEVDRDRFGPAAEMRKPVGYVSLGIYAEGKGSRQAEPCGKSIEGDAALRELMGGPIQIALLMLECDLEVDPTCHRARARAEFGWAGTSAQYVFSCVDGRLVLSPAERTLLASLREFLAGQPVRTLLQQVTKKPLFQTYDDKTWILDAGTQSLRFTPPR